MGAYRYVAAVQHAIGRKVDKLRVYQPSEALEVITLPQELLSVATLSCRSPGYCCTALTPLPYARAPS